MKLNDTHIDVLSVLTENWGARSIIEIEETILKRMAHSPGYERTLKRLDIRYSVPELSTKGFIFVRRDGSQVLGGVPGCLEGDIIEITENGTTALRDELRKRVSEL